MIKSFIESWDLFGGTYIAGWAMAVTLSLAGVLVVARDQIFIGAALAEASTLGIAIGLWLGSQPTLFGWSESEPFIVSLACGFSVLAALLTRLGTRRGGSFEAVTGWIFLFGGSVSILLVYHTPHGLEEVHRLLSTSIIGASTTEAWLHAIVAAVLAAAIFPLRRRLLLVVMDEEMAQAVGMRIGVWNLGISVSIALVVSLCLRGSGLPYTFGCLVLPVLAARSLCRRPGRVFIAAPLVALAASGASFVLANHLDEPPGQVAVAVLCLIAAAAAAVNRAGR